MQIDALGALLQLLGDGPESSGRAYRALHERLIRFFHLNGRMDPEALADEVMDRLARTAADGSNQIKSAEAFAVGIARHVVQENIRSQQRDAETARYWESRRNLADGTNESIFLALDLCMSALSAQKRDLLRSYYEWTGRRKIAHHLKLASELGLTVNALRNRLMRARKELDACVRRRLRDVSQLDRTHH